MSNKISIVITTFNDSKTIVSFLNNILVEQTEKVDEIVVSDGGSKDNTVDVINQYFIENKLSVKYKIISDGVRRNISEGINYGIKNASNNWILIMGTGNVFDRDYIKNIESNINSNECKVYYGPIDGINQNYMSYIFNQFFLNGNHLNDLGPNNHAVLIHKSVFEEIGYFWEHFVYAGEDWEFYRRLRNNNISFCYIDNAILHWDTPTTYKDYLKKMKVNAIADLQIYNKKKIIFKIVMELFLVLIFIGLIIYNLKFSLVIIPVILLAMLRKKTFNVVAIIFGIINRLIMIYYYIKNYKYSSNKYHVPKEYEL